MRLNDQQLEYVITSVREHEAHEAADCLMQHISDLETSSKQWEQSAEVWRNRVEQAADALSDMLPGEVGRLDLLSRIQALKDELARLKPSAQMTSARSIAAGYVRTNDTATLLGAREEGPTDRAEIARREGFNEGAEAMAERLTPTGQVSEDEERVVHGLAQEAGAGLRGVAREALSRLAAKAHGYEAIRKALSDNYGTDGDPLERVKDLLESEEAARNEAAVEQAERHRVEGERDAAVADNAALFQALLDVAEMRLSGPTLTAMAEKLRAETHPGAALLERHRKEVEQAYQKGRDDERQHSTRAAAGARNGGLEDAALLLLGECDGSGADTCDCDPCMFARDIRALKGAP